MVKWNDFVTWVFFGLMAYAAHSATNNIDEMSKSVQELNKNVAVVINQVSTHSSEILEIRRRLEHIEKKEK